MTSLKNKSVDSIVWTLFERYGVQIVSLVIGVFLARLLTPEDYGLIGMIAVLIAVGKVFIDSGFGAAFVQKKDVTEVDVNTIFYFNVVVSVFIYVLLWISAPLVAEFYNQKILIDLIRVTSIALVINSFSIIQVSKLTKEVNFRPRSIITIGSTLISGSMGVIAALNGFGVWSLVIQQISTSIMKVLGLWLFFNWKPKLIFEIAALKDMLNFSSWILGSSLLNTFFSNMYVLVIGKFFPMTELGLFSKAKGYQKIVSNQPMTAISLVAFPVFSKMQNDKALLRSSLTKFLKFSLPLVVLVSSILLVISDPLILILLTEKWLPMNVYFQLFLLIGLIHPFQTLNLQVLVAQGGANKKFIIELIKNSMRLLNLIVMVQYGVIFIIYGDLIISLIALFINSYYSKRMLNYGIFNQIKDTYYFFLAAGVSIFFASLLNSYLVYDISKVLLGTFVVPIIFTATVFIFDRVFIMDYYQLLKSKILRS